MKISSWLIVIISTVLTAIGISSNSNSTDFLALVVFSVFLSISALFIESWIKKIFFDKNNK